MEISHETTANIGPPRHDKPSGDEGVRPQSGSAGQSDAMKAKGKPVVAGKSDVAKANGKPAAAGQSDGTKANGKPAVEGRSNNGKGKK